MREKGVILNPGCRNVEDDKTCQLLMHSFDLWSETLLLRAKPHLGITKRLTTVSAKLAYFSFPLFKKAVCMKRSGLFCDYATVQANLLLNIYKLAKVRPVLYKVPSLMKQLSYFVSNESITTLYSSLIDRVRSPKELIT